MAPRKELAAATLDAHLEAMLQLAREIDESREPAEMLRILIASARTTSLPISSGGTGSAGGPQ